MVKLYPHQRRAVDQLHNGAILWGGVGSGKSLAAAAYYFEKEAPKDVYVITTAKKRDSLDWEKEFAKFGVGKEVGGTVAGLLVVDSWNNIGKYRNVQNAFFIFDEQRLVGSGSWVGAFIKIAEFNRWILLSATPGDTWMDYVPVFIANGFYRHRTQFKAEHVIYKPFTKYPIIDRYVGVGHLARLRDQILVEMPFLRKTVRHLTDVPVEYNKPLFDEVLKNRWNPYKEKPIVDAAELFWVLRRIINTDPSRAQAIKTLMQKYPKLIVFYNFNYELDILRTLGKEDPSWQIQQPVDIKSLTSSPNTTKPQPVGAVELNSPEKTSKIDDMNTTSSTMSGSIFQIAEWNGHKHQPIPENDNWLYFVQYNAGAEGWNCTDTDAMVFYSLPYSYKLWHQAHGRIDRLNTPYSELFYYKLLSTCIVDRAIEKCLAAKKSFNEKGHFGTI